MSDASGFLPLLLGNRLAKGLGDGGQQKAFDFGFAHFWRPQKAV
jgi:hypothetical protein